MMRVFISCLEWEEDSFLTRSFGMVLPLCDTWTKTDGQEHARRYFYVQHAYIRTVPLAPSPFAGKELWDPKFLKQCDKLPCTAESLAQYPDCDSLCTSPTSHVQVAWASGSLEFRLSSSPGDQ